MEEKTKLICISCPKGCSLDVTHDGNTILKVENAACKQGYVYAEKEFTDPRRMVASTVKVKGGLHPLVPVYTANPIPKPKIQDLLVELRKVELQAPVTGGDVVLENVFGTGINIITSRDMPAV
ncbi:MAG: DUF1667 domain-containing protein [Anaerolineaceae bacterium]|nr:DUF1667 domain-containing protein [Anaerolineaceae bacterium]